MLLVVCMLLQCCGVVAFAEAADLEQPDVTAAADNEAVNDLVVNSTEEEDNGTVDNVDENVVNDEEEVVDENVVEDADENVVENVDENVVNDEEEVVDENVVENVDENVVEDEDENVVEDEDENVVEDEDENVVEDEDENAAEDEDKEAENAEEEEDEEVDETFALAKLAADTVLFGDSALNEELFVLEEEAVVVVEAIESETASYVHVYAQVGEEEAASIHKLYVAANDVTKLTAEEVEAWQAAAHEKAVECEGFTLALASLIDEGALEVTAQGSPESDFVVVGGVLQEYKGVGGAVTIPSSLGVTEIGASAFNKTVNNVSITTIDIPSSVTKIGQKAFYGQTSLRSVMIPSVTEIGDSAFMNCTSLVAAGLKDCKKIGDHAFENCVNLDVALPDSITDIGTSAFANCSKMSSDMPSSLKTIGTSAFQNCTAMKRVILPNSVTELGAYAFAGCTGISQLVLSSGLKQISNFAFQNCSSLTELVVPNGVTVLGQYSFSGCTKLARVEIPGSVTHILQYALNKIANNAVLYINANPAYSANSIDKTAIIYGPKGGSTEEMAHKNGNRFYSVEVVNYVERCYDKLLGRKGDPAGITNWVNELISGRATGASIVSSFINSQEFLNKKYSNDKVVDILYWAMLNRAPDAPGKAEWTGYLNDGVSYDFVINGFSGSYEFYKLCNSYGVTPGSIALTQNRDKNVKVTAFVTRCYKIILERTPDVGGLNGWTGQLLAKTKSGAEIVDSFINSIEYRGRGLNIPDQIEILYKTMLGRASDPKGKSDWVNALSNDGVSLRCIVNGFAGSKEFKRICQDYGINPGTVSGLEPRDRNLGVSQFVSRCYHFALNRNGDTKGMNDWTGAILNKTQSPQSVAYGFVFSEECVDRGLNNTQFVTMLYRLYMGRSPDTKGLNDWLTNMSKGMTRQKVVEGFANSVEFTKIVEGYGIK